MGLVLILLVPLPLFFTFLLLGLMALNTFASASLSMLPPALVEYYALKNKKKKNQIRKFHLISIPSGLLVFLVLQSYLWESNVEYYELISGMWSTFYEKIVCGALQG